MLDELTSFAHSTAFKIAAPVSAVLLVLMIVLMPWLIARIPADYFVRKRPARLGKNGAGRIALDALRALAGGLLIVLGVIMLVLPGQGVLAIVAGLALLPFPGKRKLQRKLLRAPGVSKVVTAIRKRAGKPPLQLSPRA